MKYVALMLLAVIIPACAQTHPGPPSGAGNSSPTDPKTLNSFQNLMTGQPVTVQVFDHGYANGAQVELDGLFGTYNDSGGHPGLEFSSYNGLWTITNVTQNTFDLVGSSWAGQNIAGYSWYPDTPTVTLK